VNGYYNELCYTFCNTGKDIQSVSMFLVIITRKKNHCPTARRIEIKWKDDLLIMPIIESQTNRNVSLIIADADYTQDLKNAEILDAYIQVNRFEEEIEQLKDPKINEFVDALKFDTTAFAKEQYPNPA